MSRSASISVLLMKAVPAVDPDYLLFVHSNHRIDLIEAKPGHSCRIIFPGQDYPAGPETSPNGYLQAFVGFRNTIAERMGKILYPSLGNLASE